MLDIVLTSLICGLLAGAIGYALFIGSIYVLTYTHQGLRKLWAGMGKATARNHRTGTERER